MYRFTYGFVWKVTNFYGDVLILRRMKHIQAVTNYVFGFTVSHANLSSELSDAYLSRESLPSEGSPREHTLLPPAWKPLYRTASYTYLSHQGAATPGG